MATTEGPSTAVGNFILSLGAMEVNGKLLYTKVKNADKDEKFTSLCPECESTDGVKQYYEGIGCGHGPFTMKDLAKGKEQDDGTIVRLTADEVKQARTSLLPENIVELNVHRAEDVAGKVMAGDNRYIFTPNGSSKLFGLLIDLIEKRPDLVFMGLTNIRKIDKLVRISVDLNRQLVVTELLWPEHLAEFETPSVDYKAALLDQAEMLAENSVAEFDLKEYSKASRERIAELLASKTGATPTAKPKKKPVKNDDDDLADALAAAIAATKK